MAILSLLFRVNNVRLIEDHVAHKLSKERAINSAAAGERKATLSWSFNGLLWTGLERFLRKNYAKEGILWFHFTINSRKGLSTSCLHIDRHMDEPGHSAFWMNWTRNYRNLSWFSLVTRGDLGQLERWIIMSFLCHFGRVVRGSYSKLWLNFYSSFR